MGKVLVRATARDSPPPYAAAGSRDSLSCHLRRTCVPSLFDPISVADRPRTGSL